jgi:hypothetical protein
MPQSLVYILLLCALVLPMLGALVLRILARRLAPAQLYGSAAAILGIALVSLFLLARGNVPSLQLGGLSILLPVSAPEDSDLPASIVEPTTSAPPAETALASVAPPATMPPDATPTSVPAATSLPTAEPPTAAPTGAPTPTPEPTAVPTEAPAPPAAQRTYTVQSGDTLRSIAAVRRLGPGADRRQPADGRAGRLATRGAGARDSLIALTRRFPATPARRFGGAEPLHDQ